jgi:repressor LexA
MSKEQRQQSFEKLENLVRARNTTLYKVAGDLGFARSLFSDWKSGKSMPKTDKLLEISKYFGVDIDYFII